MAGARGQTWGHEYGDFITPELLMKSSGEEISCHLETFPADWNKSDLGEAADAGPAAWYIGFLFANLRVQANTWARYLVLDFQDAAPVDNDWTSVHDTRDSLVRDEEKPFLDVMYSFDEKSQPNLKGKPKIYIYSGRDMGEGSVDINVVLSWITFCNEKHRCVQRIQHDPCLRLINVHDRSVVQAPSSCRYVALSYVWGFVKISHTGKNLPERLPQTIEDAILMVKLLEESYLWVDAICINRNDPDDQAAQIQIMDQIYGGAWLTLVAGEGIDSNAGLPGVRPDSRSCQQYSKVVDGLKIHVSTPLLKESLAYGNVDRLHADQKSEQARRWINRGWTFQEGLLSSRCLIFTAYQVFWKCRKEFWCESLQEPLPHQREALVNRHDELFCSSYGDDSLIRDKSYVLYSQTQPYYFDVVEAYSRRDLTYATDRLAAFMGLGKTFKGHTGVNLLWGHPEDIFDHTLLWTPILHSKPRYGHFPSWSWTSSPGGVFFPLYHPEIQASDSTWHDFTLDSLAHKVLRVRRDHPYWKFSHNGTPEKIQQNKIRYSMAVEEEEDIVSGHSVRVVQDEQSIDGVTRVTTYIKEAAMEGQPAPPSLNIEYVHQFHTLEEGRLPLLCFAAETTKLRILPFNSTQALDNDCRVRIQAEYGEVTYTSRDEDEFVWIDYQEDLKRLLGRECEFVLLSTLETSLSKYLNVLAIERCVERGFMQRVGIGFINQYAWNLARVVRKSILLG
ncbi:hypothetical protein OIDMADRAFT_34090 [Oidiodendron maius Zn]|uniref:Heterokaryon incompatibility domain-containing protein n=1 Tax=Oidiodendron maius (strain Zn) TaxID=913774 RepID=A0A0C3GGP6_OIDMZ|nr:hypothetical protein OIDMADRAFT_34090 [Oidiodendron maius Zn]